MDMPSEEKFFGGLAVSEIQDLLKQKDSMDFSSLVSEEEYNRIPSLISQLDEVSIQVFLNNLSVAALKKVVISLPDAELNFLVDNASVRLIKKISVALSREDLFLFYPRLSASNREYFSDFMDHEVKARLAADLKISSDDKTIYKSKGVFPGGVGYATAGMGIESFNGLMEHYRESSQSLSIEVDELKKKISEMELDLVEIEREKLRNDQISVAEVEQLQQSIRLLQERHQKELQQKIEAKVPEFVRSAIEALERKEEYFSRKAELWNWQGHSAMALAILVSLLALWYGGDLLRSDATKANIDWFFFGFLLLKGLIVISLFAAWAKHSYSIANAYVHESLKRSDRTHAINFGKLYLEVYGNDVSQADMKAVFENWNLDSDSAFVKIKTGSFEPKVMGQVTQLIDSISKATTAKPEKSEKTP